MTDQTLMGLDFGEAPTPPKTLSKKGFAEELGLTPARVSQLIERGLPVQPNGRIDVAAGRSWYLANVDANRRRAGGSQGDGEAQEGPLTPRAMRDQAEAEISRLKAEALAGRHVNRKATIKVLEARAKYERDAWIGWVNRVSPALAAATGADVSAVTAFLDRAVRDQLVTLASTPTEIPKR